MYRGILLIGSALLPCMASAQSTTTNEGPTSQRIDDYYEQRQPLQPRQPVVDPVQQEASVNEGPAVADTSTRFQLTEVHFSPSELLPAETLDAIRARYQGREVSLAELNQIVAEVNAAYEAQASPRQRLCCASSPSKAVVSR